MRNAVTLETIRTEVQIEAGLSTDAGHTIYSAERLNQMINRTERRLSHVFDWPNMEFEEQVTVAADASLVNLPSNINFTNIDTVHVSYGDDWVKVTHGIGARERSVYNTTQRAEPIQRWEIQAPGNAQFEVWPIGSNEQTLLFSGTKNVGAMTDDTDTCVLDADVIVMYVAAEILGRDQKDDAQLKLQMGKELAESIIMRQGSTKRDSIDLGRQNRVRLRPGIDFIAPGS